MCRVGRKGKDPASARPVKISRNDFSTASMDPATMTKVPLRNSTGSKSGVIERFSKGVNMDSVFILWHSHEIDGISDEKLIGVYIARTDAEAAISRLNAKPGFRDVLDGFEIHEYVLGRDGWTEGYVSEAEAMEVED